MMRKDEPVLLRTLKDRGYFVWWGGKNDLVPAQDGFDDYCDVKYRPTKPIKTDDGSWRGGPDADLSFFRGLLEKNDGDEFYNDSDWANVLGAIEFIKNRPANQPFCLYLPLNYPHPPFAVEEPFFSMIDRDKVPPRISEPENWSSKPSMLKGIYENTGMQNWTEDRWTELRAVFYGMCSRLDYQFGLLTDALRDGGVYDDTAIFFFTDHGSYVGDYGIVNINQNTFDDSLSRVPLIIKPPADTPIKPGICDALTELVDFPATVEDLLGIKPGYSHFGRSLLPLIAGETTEHRDAVFCEGGRLHGETHCMELEYEPGYTDPDNLYYPRLILQASEGPEHTKAVMCRTKTHKYIKRFYEPDELYDLQQDPQELHNVIENPAYTNILNELKEHMLNWYMETCDVVPHKPDQRSLKGN